MYNNFIAFYDNKFFQYTYVIKELRFKSDNINHIENISVYIDVLSKNTDIKFGIKYDNLLEEFNFYTN